MCSGSLVILDSASGQDSDRGKGKILPLQATNHKGIVWFVIFYGQERGGTICSGDGRYDSPGIPVFCNCNNVSAHKNVLAQSNFRVHSDVLHILCH